MDQRHLLVVNRGALILFEISLPNKVGPLALFVKYGDDCAGDREGECEKQDTSCIVEHHIHKRMDVAQIVEKYLDEN